MVTHYKNRSTVYVLGIVDYGMCRLQMVGAHDDDHHDYAGCGPHDEPYCDVCYLRIRGNGWFQNHVCNLRDLPVLVDVYLAVSCLYRYKLVYEVLA